MSCGQIAFERAGIKIDKYYASEIDKYAIKVTQSNYPDTVQLGSITEWQSWNIEKPDIIIGGSPCQGFSFAGKGLNFDDPRSKLFFEFYEILKQYKPKYFLFENVIMKKESNDVISSLLGELYPECVTYPELFRTGRLEPIEINSALVSAQNRRRLYWTNIPGIEQPENKGILLKDVIENGECDRNKSLPITATYIFAGNENDYVKKSKRQLVIKCGAIRGRNPENPTSRESGLDTVQMLEIRDDEKTNTLTSVQKDNVLCYAENYIQYDLLGKEHNSQNMRIFFKEKQSGCLNVSHSSIPKIKETETEILYRKLTVRECARLQTVPENIIDKMLNCGVSNSQLYKMLGNGWTVEVISHIFSYIPELKIENSKNR